jgi:hypothetical protein
MATIPILDIGAPAIAVGVIALIIGNILELTYRQLPKSLAPVRLLLIAVAYALLRKYLDYPAESWAVFAPCVFATQPSAFGDMKQLLGIGAT